MYIKTTNMIEDFDDWRIEVYWSIDWREYKYVKDQSCVDCWLDNFPALHTFEGNKLSFLFNTFLAFTLQNYRNIRNTQM